MALADVFQIDHIQSLAGAEEIRNVYHYLRTSEGFTAEQVYTAFFEDVLPFVMDIQTSQIFTERIRVISLGDLDEFHEVAFSGFWGTYSSGDELPLHDALAITLRPNSRVVRPGSKRYAGVPESAATHGVITEAGYITNINLLRTALHTGLVIDGPDEDLLPVIVKRVREGSEMAGYTYRLPTSDGELEYARISSALVNLRVSHQISRGNARQMAFLVSEDRVLDISEALLALNADCYDLLDAIDANFGNPVDWTEAQRKHFLGEYTRLVAMLGLDIACYPLGVSAVIFFPDLP